MAASTKLEQAKALGFDSIEVMEDHQRWLDIQNVHKQKCIAAVSKAVCTGTNVIYMR